MNPSATVDRAAAGGLRAEKSHSAAPRLAPGRWRARWQAFRRPVAGEKARFAQGALGIRCRRNCARRARSADGI